MAERRGAGSHHHRPHRCRADRQGRAEPQADRQFRRRGGQYRRRGRHREGHRRHQHARRADRRHRRHDHGADPGGAAPAGGRRGGAGGRDSSRAGRPAGCWATGCRASGWALSAWAASARRWRAAPGRSACRSTITTASRSRAEIEQELEATYWDSLDQMLARMDIVSVNCPHTPATFHLLSARRLKLMKPSAYIVNTARGEVIDENCMALMLEKGELSGAGLDVFENEPAVNPKLLQGQECGAAAAYGLGHHRGPHRHGREGDRQHQDALSTATSRPTASSRRCFSIISRACAVEQFDFLLRTPARPAIRCRTGRPGTVQPCSAPS